MHRNLLIGLGASVLLSVWVIWTEKPELSPVSERQTNDRRITSKSNRPSSPVQTSWEALPSEFPVIEIVPPKRDIFSPLGATSAPETKVQGQSESHVTIAPASTPPIRPTPPPLEARFLGRVINADGESVVYLLIGAEALSVRVGEHLQNGYTIESVSDNAVTLTYQPSETHVVVTIPALPDLIDPFVQ